MNRFWKGGFCILMSLLAVVSVEAQKRECGTKLGDYLNTPEKIASYNSYLEQVAEYIKNNPYSKHGRSTVFSIPVVVQVLHNGEAVGEGDNLSDEQIFSQIEVLNEDFRNLNADGVNTPSVFKSLAADLEVEFCLAKRDTNGNPTSGIVRINTGRANWSRDDLDDYLKPNTAWRQNEYLNIWTARLGGADASILGYAFFPGIGGDADGVVVQPHVFGRGSQFNLLANHKYGRTATHEVGHYLGLHHLWGDSDPDVTNCLADDGVNDTPEQGKANYGCPTFPRVSCNNGPNGDMFMNYMDYVNDNCSNLFTLGQKTLVQATLNVSRNELGGSGNICQDFSNYQYDVSLFEIANPVEYTCQGVFTPSIVVKNYGSEIINELTIGYQVDNSSQLITSWVGFIDNYTPVLIPLPTLSLSDGVHTLTITLYSPNGEQDENNLNNQRIASFEVIDEQVTSFSTPFSQGFQDNFPPDNWVVYNPQNDRAWEQVTGFGAFGMSGKCVKFDNYNTNGGTFDPAGKSDALITPVYNFQNSETSAMLRFSVAYARKNANSDDSLKIYSSFDCGKSWQLIWTKSGINLATAPDQNSEFVPTSTDWVKYSMGMLKAQAQDRVQFKFENLSDAGNVVYLDDIKVEAIGVGISNVKSSELKVYPNPSEGEFIIDLGNETAKSITVYSINGKLIYQNNNYTIGLKTINLKNIARSGLYFLAVETENGIIRNKIVIK